MIKKYVIITALVGNMAFDLHINAQQNSISKITSKTLHCIKKYSFKLARLCLYIGIPAALTSATLYYYTYRPRTSDNAAPFWDVVNDRIKIESMQVQKTTRQLMHTYIPTLKNSVKAVCTTTVKGIHNIAQEVASIVTHA